MNLYWTLRRRYFALKNAWTVKRCPHLLGKPVVSDGKVGSRCVACHAIQLLTDTEFYSRFGCLPQEVFSELALRRRATDTQAA